MQPAFRFNAQPNGAMSQEGHDEENTPSYAVRIEQGKQVALEYAILVKRDPLKDVCKGYPKKQGRKETAHKQACIPKLFPCGVVNLTPEFK